MNNDDPRLSVISGIAKMFVGELVETARLIMVKRNEAGHIRPCHIRESYRRLKLQGKRREEGDRPLNLVYESYPCDLSVINGYDCLQTLCAVEDRYPVRSDPLRSARLIMVKRNETGHIRPCHIRESYRKSKLQGKVIRRSVPRLSAKSESDSEKDKIITSFFFIDSCLLNTIYCNDPDPNEVIKNKPGSRGRRIITYFLLGVFR
ncbi:hypothetical protein IGI04_002202 [Brassica rapa subsp. trilocularis]|uniref:TAFII28-like protein domain-containing protein n=1 Tax=Brassica rapa subsp. trilocularis TaxID=1813537 RepID=A0ABQ7NUW7_BRACM|nr:hypothetical protein IGI04_002202 [Brassica rapa subsp. trilocularis]